MDHWGDIDQTSQRVPGMIMPLLWSLEDHRARLAINMALRRTLRPRCHRAFHQRLSAIGLKTKHALYYNPMLMVVGLFICSDK